MSKPFPYMLNYDSLVTPFFEGNTVFEETCLFRELFDQTVSDSSLFYRPEEILSVHSYDRTVMYSEGLDYILDGSRIIRLPDSRIPYFPLSGYCVNPDEHPDLAWIKLKEPYRGVVPVGNAEIMKDYYVSVTYRHRDTWDGPSILSQAARLPRLSQKLQSGKPVHVLFYGDSITVGWNSSGLHETAVDMNSLAVTEYFSEAVPPYIPNWATLVTGQMAHRYGIQVSRLNRAAGGSQSHWGNQNKETLLANTAPDLAVVAFGMNEASRDPEEFRADMKDILDYLRFRQPNVEFILVSAMIPNPEILCFSPETLRLSEQEQVLSELCEEYGGAALAPVNAVFRHLSSRKNYPDFSGNMINHPNDFAARIYAQTVLRTIGAL